MITATVKHETFTFPVGELQVRVPAQIPGIIDVTRDTFGFAMKATAGIVNGQRVEIFKDPVTDDGVKRSAKGLLRVNADMTLSQQVTPEEERGGELAVVFQDGLGFHPQNLQGIRERLEKQLFD